MRTGPLQMSLVCLLQMLGGLGWREFLVMSFEICLDNSSRAVLIFVCDNNMHYFIYQSYLLSLDSVI